MRCGNVPLQIPNDVTVYLDQKCLSKKHCSLTALKYTVNQSYKDVLEMARRSVYQIIKVNRGDWFKYFYREFLFKEQDKNEFKHWYCTIP